MFTVMPTVATTAEKLKYQFCFLRLEFHSTRSHKVMSYAFIQCSVAHPSVVKTEHTLV